MQKSTHESRRITALELVWGPSLSYITTGMGCRVLKPHQLDSMNTSVTKKSPMFLQYIRVTGFTVSSYTCHIACPTKNGTHSKPIVTIHHRREAGSTEEQWGNNIIWMDFQDTARLTDFTSYPTQNRSFQIRYVLSRQSLG